MIQSRQLFLISFTCITALIISGCGGGSDTATSIQQQDDNTAGTPDTTTSEPLEPDNETNSSGPSDSFSEGSVAGNYLLTATPTNQVNQFLDCSVVSGAVSVYDGEIVGFIDTFLSVNGAVSSSGQVTASATSFGTIIASISGQLDNQSGSGTYQQTGLCSGNWAMQRIDFEPPSQEQPFTLSDDNFPVALRIRFTPSIVFNENEVECTSAEGIIHTNGLIGTLDNELNYDGYAETSAGYRSDIDFSIDTDSGEMEGSYRYDPLGISGDFDGDAFFSATPRRYSSKLSSYDNGCEGDWEFTVVDIPFLDRPAPTDDQAEQPDAQDFVNEDETTDEETVDQPEVANDPQPETTDDNGETDEPVTEEQPNSPESVTNIGYYNVTPYCLEAGQRIQQSIEIGMTVQQVREIVGKPLHTSGSGTFWDYSTRSSGTPEIRFQATIADGRLGPGTVSGFDSDTSRCDNRDDALIEAANTLALEPQVADHTLETPTCSDAGIRIQAYAEPGMTPDEVRSIVGKPIKTDASGTFWDYGRTGSTPEIRFNPVSTAEGLLADKLVDFDSDISGCS